MLLLTTLTVGAAEDSEIFQLMPASSAARLQEKAGALLEIDKTKRVPFMVKQMKQAMSFKGLRGVEKVDPSWLLQGMRGESPRVVAAILVSLPPQAVRSVLKRLPQGIRKHLPAKDELQRVPVELVRAVRQIFESRFHAMPRATTSRTFAFTDIIHLERKDVYRALRDFGLTELGRAFGAVGKLALAELCRRLPRTRAEELILAVRETAATDLPELRTAQKFLSRVVVNFEDTEEFFHNAGLWRVAKACMVESPEFRAAFRQRMPREAGELFRQFLDTAGELDDVDEAHLQQLQDICLVRLKILSERGIITGSLCKLEFVYHDPAFADEMLAPPEPEPDSGIFDMNLSQNVDNDSDNGNVPPPDEPIESA